MGKKKDSEMTLKEQLKKEEKAYVLQTHIVETPTGKKCITVPVFIDKTELDPCCGKIPIKKQKVLTSDRIILKNIEDKDQKGMIEIVKDPLVKKTYMLPDLNNEQEEKVYFNRLKNLTLSDEHYSYGIYLKDKVVGFINDVVVDNDEIEVGFFINPKYWNQGITSEALNIMIKELFRVGFNRVVAGHFVENPASGRVMQKCGMKLIDKEEDIVYRGAIHHVLYYTIEK